MEKPRKKELSHESFCECGDCIYYAGWNACHDAMSTWLDGELPSKEELRGISAQGYCTKRNSHKVLDSELLEDVSDVIHAFIKRKLTGNKVENHQNNSDLQK